MAYWSTEVEYLSTEPITESRRTVPAFLKVIDATIAEGTVLPFPSSRWKAPSPSTAQTSALQTQRSSPSGPLQTAGAPTIDRAKLLQRVDQLWNAVKQIHIAAVHQHIDNPKSAPHNTDIHREMWLEQAPDVDIRTKYICLNREKGSGWLVVDTSTGLITACKGYGVPNRLHTYGNIMTISAADLAKIWIGNHIIYGREVHDVVNHGTYVVGARGIHTIIQRQLARIGLAEDCTLFDEDAPVATRKAICPICQKSHNVPVNAFKEFGPRIASTCGDCLDLQSAAFTKQHNLNEESFQVKCQECGKVFKTSSQEPKCPKCGGYDIDLA